MASMAKPFYIALTRQFSSDSNPGIIRLPAPPTKCPCAGVIHTSLPVPLPVHIINDMSFPCLISMLTLLSGAHMDTNCVGLQ